MEEEIRESLQQPAWHVVALGMLTGMAYMAYWFYKNWRDLKRCANSADASDDAALLTFKDINPLLRAILLILPPVQIYLGLTYSIAIASLHPDPNSFPRKHPLLVSGLVVGSAMSILLLANLPGPWMLLYLLGSIPYAFVQHWLNAYWATVEPDEVLVRHAFSLGEMVAIILGASMLGLITAGFMIGRLH